MSRANGLGRRLRTVTATKLKTSDPPRESLEQMLAQGWRIEPPVYARPAWHSPVTLSDANTYHFVLCRKNQVNLVSVAESPEIRQFLVDSDLPIDYL